MNTHIFPDLQDQEFASESFNHEITADDFFNYTAEQRASLPENLSIIGDLNFESGRTLPAGLSTFKLPDNVTIKGDLILGNDEFSTLKELPVNLTVTGHVDGRFSEIKSLPYGFTVLGNADFARSKLEFIERNVKIYGALDISDSGILSIVGIKPYVSSYNEYTGGSELSYVKFNSNFIKMIVDSNMYINKNLLVQTLERAVKEGADLSEANLQLYHGVNLSGANLAGARFHGANLQGVNFIGANLQGADFTKTKLCGANFTGAKIYGANFTGAYLADLSDVDLTEKQKRIDIASTEDTHHTVLSTLAKDKDPEVRMVVAGNPNMPQGALATLAKDENPKVRWAVTKNPNTTVKILATLAKDKDLDVRISATHFDIFFMPAHIPSKIGNVEITVAQRLALQEGKCIEIKRIKDKTGKMYDTTYVIFDQKTNKVKILRQQGENKFQKAQVKQVNSVAKTVPKGKGMKI
jgi:uncharacterized protein YjbI with pentapeptide repeats